MASQPAADGVALPRGVPAGQEPALVEALPEGPRLHGQAVALLAGQGLRRGVGGLGFKEEVAAAEPAEAVALRAPFLAGAAGGAAPPPALGVVRGPAVRAGDVAAAGRQGAGQQPEEVAARLGGLGVFGLPGAGVEQRLPDPALQRAPFLGRDRPDLKGVVEPVAPAGGQVREDARRPGVQPLGVDTFPERSRLGPQPVADRGIARGQPAHEPGQGRGVQAGGRVALAGGQPAPVQLDGGQLQDQQPGAEALAPGHVLAGAQNRPARRPGRAHRAVRPAAAPAGAVALRPQQPVGLAVDAGHVGDAPPRREVVHDQQGVGGREGQPLQAVARARPTAGKVPRVEARPVLLLGQGRQLRLARAGRPGQVVGVVGGRQDGAVGGAQQGGRDAVGRQVEQAQGRADRRGQFLPVRRRGQDEAGQRVGQLDLDALGGAARPDRAAGVQVDPTASDLLPAGVSVDHAPGRMVRVARILCGVVVGEFHFDSRTGPQSDRSRIAVLVLPVEVPVGNVKQGPLAAVREDRVPPHVFTDIVRVRDDAEQIDIHRQREVVAHYEIARPRWNVDTARAQRDIGEVQPWRLGSEVECHSRAVGFPLAGGVIVHLEHQIRARVERLSHAGWFRDRLLSGRPSTEPARGQEPGRAKAGVAAPGIAALGFAGHVLE